MKYKIKIQIHNMLRKDTSLPNTKHFYSWCFQTLKTTNIKKKIEINIRLTNNEEMITFNKIYKNKYRNTNILSFSNTFLKNYKTSVIGNIAICVEIIKHEAKQQNKNLINHFGHITIHGILHLLKYDHNIIHQAKKMKNIEKNILMKLGFKNPDY